MRKHSYTRKACISFVVAVLLFAILPMLPRNAYYGPAAIFAIAVFGLDVLTVIAGTIFSIIAVVREKRILSWICLAVFLVAIPTYSYLIFISMH